ncbi:MAG: long-chain fatty acid--CoA ligase [Deltaproteobacteria bacterium]|nr:long-chain fatty acid--CoA ligase [Deltaproteobacteria bacterium]
MKTIDGQIFESCLRMGDKAAFQQKVGEIWQPVSYRNLWAESEQITSGLQKTGIKKGDRVAILAVPSPRWVTAYLAILKADAIVVPVDKELKAGEVRHILTDCEARVIFTEEPYLDTVVSLFPGLPKLEKIVIMHPDGDNKIADPVMEMMVDDLVTEWRRISQKYELPREETTNFEQLADKFYAFLLKRESPADLKNGIGAHLLGGQEILMRRLFKKRRLDYLSGFRQEESPAPPQHHPSDAALIIYTSGTTGRSKGAILSHSNIMSNVYAGIDLYRLTDKVHMLSVLPIHHVFEQVLGIVLPLTLGGTVAFVESLKKIGPNLQEVQPNFMLGVPALYRIFFNRIRKKIDDSHFLKTVFSLPGAKKLVQSKILKSMGGGGMIFISGGAALDPEIQEGLKKFGLTIYQGYGITETSPVVSAESPTSQRFGSVGKVLPGVEVKILDPNEEGIGEILVKGPNVMQGYFKNSEATEEVLRDGWYYSGDLGRFDADGFLYICGRLKNLIVTPNGKNVYPEEIENELLKSEFIAEVMVYGHKIDKTAEEVYALIYPNQEAVDNFGRQSGKGPFGARQVEELIRREVQERCKNLADFKRIKKFSLREDEFPKTTTKKIKRFVVEPDIAALE